MKLTPIDIASPGACVQFSDSLKDTGFAVLKMGDPDLVHLLENVYSQWAEFFANPVKEMFDYRRQKDHSGYFPFRSENSKDSNIKDLKEFYHLYSHKDVPIYYNTKNAANSMGFDGSTMELRNKLLELGDTLLMWLDFCGDYHDQFTGSEKLPEMIKGSQQSLLRILHYPPLKGVEEEGAVRAAAHEDINLITLLPSATQSGLQVLAKDGTWYDVPGEKGWIIVNAGDMLQEATSGYYKSTTHRVVNPQGKDAEKSRYSIPLFIHPRPEVRLSEKYTAQQYLDERLKELGLK